MLVQELLAEEIGVAPSKVDAIWNAKKLLFSYPYSSYYRTDPTKDDPDVVEKATERFECVLAHPDTYPVGGHNSSITFCLDGKSVQPVARG